MNNIPPSMRLSPVAACVAKACRQIGHEYRVQQLLSRWAAEKSNG